MCRCKIWELSIHGKRGKVKSLIISCDFLAFLHNFLSEKMTKAMEEREGNMRWTFLSGHLQSHLHPYQFLAALPTLCHIWQQLNSTFDVGFGRSIVTQHTILINITHFYFFNEMDVLNKQTNCRAGKYNIQQLQRQYPGAG